MVLCVLLAKTVTHFTSSAVTRLLWAQRLPPLPFNHPFDSHVFTPPLTRPFDRHVATPPSTTTLIRATRALLCGLGPVLMNCHSCIDNRAMPDPPPVNAQNIEWMTATNNSINTIFFLQRHAKLASACQDALCVSFRVW